MLTLGLGWYIPIFLLVGACIGFIGGVLGIGGGLLAIPLLVLLLDMDQQMAQGTALIMVLPAVLLTIRKYNQYARIDRPAAITGALSSSVFTWIGAQVALGMSSSSLRLIFIGFVLVAAIYYLYQSLWSSKQQSLIRKTATDYPLAYFAVIGILAGTAGGVFGVGGSIVAVPVLTGLLALTQVGAQAIALTMITPGVVVALMAYAAQEQVDWLIGLPMALGSISLVPVGVRLAHGMSEPKLKLIFAGLLLVIMTLLLIKS